ncbi:hypothetical protein [Streptomyces sp. NPDC057686]|uniref:hypothetical protein n=1 Tax=Streptomyces sp. NPDC057686 TaxID=3346212 RepID=UPI0036C05313
MPMAANRRLSLAEQVFALRIAFPEGQGRINKGKQQWLGGGHTQAARVGQSSAGVLGNF